jgi:hypothetical protein
MLIPTRRINIKKNTTSPKGNIFAYFSKEKTKIVQRLPVKSPRKNLLWDSVSFVYPETRYAQR